MAKPKRRTKKSRGNVGSPAASLPEIYDSIIIPSNKVQHLHEFLSIYALLFLVFFVALHYFPELKGIRLIKVRAYLSEAKMNEYTSDLPRLIKYKNSIPKIVKVVIVSSPIVFNNIMGGG